MNFNRFVTGFVVGNIVGLTGAALASSKDNKKHWPNHHKRDWMIRVGNLVDDIVDSYK